MAVKGRCAFAIMGFYRGKAKEFSRSGRFTCCQVSAVTQPQSPIWGSLGTQGRDKHLAAPAGTGLDTWKDTGMPGFFLAWEMPSAAVKFTEWVKETGGKQEQMVKMFSPLHHMWNPLFQWAAINLPLSVHIKWVEEFFFTSKSDFYLSWQ